MKKTILFIIIASVSLLTSCDYRQSSNKDFVTGARSRGDGLSVEDVLIKINGTVEARSQFAFGEKIQIIFNKIEGLTKEDGRSFPEMSMHIIKNDLDTILSQKDMLLANSQKGLDLDPLQLLGRFEAIMPYQNNEEYRIIIHIWDRKGKGTFTYELPFTVTPNTVINIESSGITYEYIYLWNNTSKQVITNQEINGKDEIYLLFDGLDGLNVRDGMVFPKLSMTLLDNAGNELLYSENLYADYEKTGISEEEFAKQVPITITFPSKPLSNPIKIAAKLSDINSEISLDVSGELTVN